MTEEDIKIRDMYLKLKGGIFNFKGNSMNPSLKEGDMLKVFPVKKNNIRANDIVIFKADTGVLGCHRILGRFRENDKVFFLEKGDNADKIGHIFYEDIIGRVKYVVTEDGLKRPPFACSKKNNLFFLLDFFIIGGIRISGFLKNRLFFKKNNVFFKILGSIVWRVYCFYFKLITKIPSRTIRNNRLTLL